jgi:hypothetical protein
MQDKNLEFALTKCFYCGGDNQIIFNKRLSTSEAKKIKEANGKVVNMEPCPKCAEYMKQGIMFISVANGTDHSNPYRTGNICFIEDEVWKKLQLPKKGDK